MPTFYPYGTGLCGAIKLTMSDLRDKLCDVLPVLRLSSTGSNIIWEVRTSAAFLDISPDMLHILNRGANRTWSNFVFHKVTKYEYCIGDAGSMKIVIKSSAREEWMPWNPKADGKKEMSENTRRAMAGWRIFNGLGHLKQMPLVLVEGE